MSLSQKIWRAASQGHASADACVNLSAIARRVGVRVATVWAYHHGKVRWPADLWLSALLLTGVAEISGRTLTITLPEDDTEALGFDAETLRRLCPHERPQEVAPTDA
jgi:hypothetical protein